MINKIFMSGYSSSSSTSSSSSSVLSKYSMIFVSFIILMSFNINSNVDANPQYSDLPPPPVKPERFTSKQQLKDYLVKLHEYYAIIGRPRFGRSSPSLPRVLSDFDSSSSDMTSSSSSEQTMDSSNSNKNDDSSILSSLLTPSSSSSSQSSSSSSLSDTDSEFTSMNAKPRIYIPTEMVISEIDTNNDGLVSVDELRHFLQMFYDSE